MAVYRWCKTQIMDAGTPTYVPTINFVASSVVKMSVHSDWMFLP